MNEKCSAHAQQFESLLDSFTGDGVNVFCAQYSDETDACSKILEKLPKLSKKVNYKNFILPMLDLFSSV